MMLRRRSLFFIPCLGLLAYVSTFANALQQSPHNGTNHGLDFKYRPKHIHPQFCRTLSEEKCKKMDEEEGQTMEENRLFLTKRGRQVIRESLEDESFRKLQTNFKTEGTLNVLVLLIIFEGQEDQRDFPPRAEYDSIFNADDVDDSLYPSGSVKRYFETTSYGEFSIQATVADWVVSDNTEAFYAGSNRGVSDDFEASFTPALKALDAQGFDFTPFDQNGDFRLDLTVVLHSGYDTVYGGTDCNTGAAGNSRINAHARGGSTNDWRGLTGYALGPYAVASAFRDSCDSNSNRIGVIVHEMIHPFGIPDLYDIDGSPNPFSNAGLGDFGIMASPRGQGNRIAWPGHVCAWTRWFLGWVEPIEITSDGTYEARAVARFPDVYRISEGYADNEYLLIENRQPIPGDFDRDFYDPGGILIYHIDENVLDSDCGFGNCPAGGTYQSGWPQNGLHYPIALIQRDGEFDLEQGNNNGHIEDVYMEGAEALTPGTGGVQPNTDSYVNGNIVNTGITISNFRVKEGSDPRTMIFDVSGLRQVEPVTDAPTDLPTATPIDDPSESPTAIDITLVPTEAPTLAVSQSGSCNPIGNETACLDEDGCFWCSGDDICRGSFSQCPGNGLVVGKLNVCAPLNNEMNCTDTEECFWCDDEAGCRASEEECPGQGRGNPCRESETMDDCDAKDVCKWFEQTETCVGARGAVANDVLDIECPVLSNEGTCTLEYNCRWCQSDDECENVSNRCEDGSLGERGDPCGMADSELLCGNSIECLWCLDVSKCEKATNDACIIEEDGDDDDDDDPITGGNSTQACGRQDAGPECSEIEGCQWCGAQSKCKVSQAQCSALSGDIDLGMTEGQGGAFTIRDDGLGGTDPNAVSVVLSYLHEVNSDGVIINASLVDLEFQQFEVKQSIGTFFDGLEARRFTFEASIEGVGKIAMKAYIMLTEGTISTDTEKWPVQVGDVKFDVELSEWTFCGETSPCGNVTETGEYIDLAFHIVGKADSPEQSEDDALQFNLGGNVPLLLSSQVEVDSFLQDMPDGFPRAENTEEQGTVFVFRFPRFDEAAEYDSVIPYHTSILSNAPDDSTPTKTPTPVPSPPPTAAPTIKKAPKSDENSLSGGALAGIIIGSLLGLCLCGAVVVVVLKRRGSDSSDSAEGKNTMDGDENVFEDEMDDERGAAIREGEGDDDEDEGDNDDESGEDYDDDEEETDEEEESEDGDDEVDDSEDGNSEDDSEEDSSLV